MRSKGDLEKYEARLARVDSVLSKLAEHVSAGNPDLAKALRTAWQQPGRSLAFRNADTDWQIWVQAGDRPVPRKYVITSKTMAAAPEYTLRIYNWSFAPGPDAFKFSPSQDMKKVAFEDLKNIDELPPPAAPGGGQ